MASRVSRHHPPVQFSEVVGITYAPRLKEVLKTVDPRNRLLWRWEIPAIPSWDDQDGLRRTCERANGDMILGSGLRSGDVVCGRPTKVEHGTTHACIIFSESGMEITEEMHAA